MIHLKYFIILDQSRCEMPVFLPLSIPHDRFVSSAVSAGFVRINLYGVEVYGKSTALDLKSRPEDKDIIIEALSQKPL